MESILKFVLQSNMLVNIIKKFVVCRILHQTYFLEVGLMQIPRDHETLSIVHHVRLGVDFSSMKSFMGL